MSIRAKRIVANALAAFFGLGLLGWPFMSFGAVFVFDNPSSMLAACYIAFTIWLYPAFWIAGLALSRIGAQRGQSVLLVLLPGCIPLLSALWYVMVPVLGPLLWQVATQEQHNRLFVSAPEVYDLGNDEFAVQNYQGWFTGHKNFNMKNQEPFSAWRIDLSRRSGRSTIVLGPDNLDRDFFRNNDKRNLTRVPPAQNPPLPNRPVYQFLFGDPSITILLRNATCELKLKQD